MSNGTPKRKVIRVVFAEAEDSKGMVQCILREGTEVLVCGEQFKARVTNDTWPIMLPKEMLEDPNAWSEEE